MESPTEWTEGMELRVLFIDDECESVEPAAEEIKASVPTARTKVADFDGAEELLRDFEPHVAIIDILKSAADGSIERVGLEALNFVWKEHFCPLIVYSAISKELEGELKPNPFVEFVNKGAGSEEILLACIKKFNPHITALDEAEREIRLVMNRALRDVAPRVFAETREPQVVNDILVRSARRLVAAAMDDALSSLAAGPSLRPWEHYLCPAWGKQLLTGDIIRAVSGEPTDPAAFSVVLTPSCDLAHDGRRPPKVSHVLVAGCRPVDGFLQDIKVSPRPKDKHRDMLISELNQGYGPSHLPLPALRDQFPPMVADLRALELIATARIGEAAPLEYFRVASVDHPFRELVSWAYMHVAARPGLPDRDCRSWAEEIFDAVSPAATEPEQDASN